MVDIQDQDWAELGQHFIAFLAVGDWLGGMDGIEQSMLCPQTCSLLMLLDRTLAKISFNLMRNCNDLGYDSLYKVEFPV